MPSGQFWGQVMSGVGQAVQKATEERRQEQERQRALELQVLGKIPMEELSPEQQEAVLRKQLGVIHQDTAGPLGKLAGRLTGRSKREATALENHPVLRLFRQLQPKAPAGTELGPLPAPPSQQTGDAADGEYPEGGQPAWDQVGIEPLPVPASPAAYSAVTAQGPVQMVQASPAKARYGMYGPSYAQRLQLQTEKQLQAERERGIELARQKAAERAQQRAEDLRDIGSLPPAMQDVARFIKYTGHPMPVAPHVPESTLDTSVITMVSPSGQIWTGTRREGLAKGQQGWTEYHREPAESASAQHKEEGIQQIMQATGMSRAQAETEYYGRLERKQRMETQHLAAGTAALTRQANEPSPGERGTLTDLENKVAAILKEARAHAQKVAAVGSPEWISFRMRTKRDPTAAEIRQAEQDYSRQAFEDLNLDPQEVQAAVASVRSRLGAGGGQSSPAGGGAGGARRPNPGWTPR